MTLTIAVLWLAKGPVVALAMLALILLLYCPPDLPGKLIARLIKRRTTDE